MLAHLVKYEIQGGSGRPYLRYRCERCGAFALDQISTVTGSKQWGALAGLLTRVAGVLEIAGWEFCNSTVDGGVSAFLPLLPSFLGEGRASDRVSDRGSLHPEHLVEGDDSSTEDSLPVKCACGSVDLVVSRPSASDAQVYCYSPPADEGGPTRYLTTACACASCRTTTGSCLPALAVTHVPLANLHPASSPTGSSLDPLAAGWARDFILPGSVAYRSSDRATRYRCAGACGASVGCVTAAMPTVIKLSTGLLRAREGTLARRWCFWWTGTDDDVAAGEVPPSINAAGEALDQRLVRDWIQGLKQWGIVNGLRK